jgi:radical SAM superfamily enzyme YgiQ (UPF0313 family)
MFLLLNAHQWDPPSPPAALDYVAWELEKMGIPSTVVDTAQITIEQLTSLLQENQYAGVCITIRNLEKTVFSQKLHFPLMAVKELISLVRQYCDAPVIVGGNGFSILPSRILEYTGADYGIAGCGEDVLPQLVENLRKGKDLKSVPHVVYRQGDTIIRNPNVPSQGPLPYIKRGYVSYGRYYSPGIENFAGFAPVETQRGCPHHCIFCVEPDIKGHLVRVKPPEKVSQEVDWFLKNGITHFFLADSEFNANCEAAISLLEYWNSHGYHRTMQWIAYATPANFPQTLAELLPECGNLSTMIDFSHISDTMLSQLGKGFTSSQVEETISYCEKYQVPFRGSLMLGGPGETRDTLKEAIEFFKGINCEIFVVLGIRIFPNTPLGKKIQNDGPLVDNSNLYGKVMDNDHLLEPVYYISHHLGEDVFQYLQDLIGSSEQFYTPSPPFTLNQEMHGPFRGVKPGYEAAGRLEKVYISGEEDIMGKR